MWVICLAYLWKKNQSLEEILNKKTNKDQDYRKLKYKKNPEYELEEVNIFDSNDDNDLDGMPTPGELINESPKGRIW